MALYAFYGIFTSVATRDACFHDDYEVIQNAVSVPNWERNYDYGPARLIRKPGSSVLITICDLGPSAASYADQIEGVHRGMYRRDTALNVFGDDWPSDAITSCDPAAVTVYMMCNVKEDE